MGPPEEAKEETKKEKEPVLVQKHSHKGGLDGFMPTITDPGTFRDQYLRGRWCFPLEKEKKHCKACGSTTMCGHGEEKWVKND